MLGARVPIILTSRADNVRTRMASCAVAALYAHHVEALILAKDLKGKFVVDDTPYDTTSILATIERRYGLAPLSSRDAAVDDLSNVFDAREAKDVKTR